MRGFKFILVTLISKNYFILIFHLLFTDAASCNAIKLVDIDSQPWSMTYQEHEDVAPAGTLNWLLFAYLKWFFLNLSLSGAEML